MSKYQRKPVVIEAFQMTLGRRWNNADWPEWLHRAWNMAPGEGALYIDADDSRGERLVVGTLQGVYRVSWGDWIIQGVKGALYACKPDIFEATYERVGEPDEIIEIDEDGIVHGDVHGVLRDPR